MLGRIPIEPGVRSGGDAGVPITPRNTPPATFGRRIGHARLARTVAGRISVIAAPFATAGVG